jgi:hypothetical protein
MTLCTIIRESHNYRKMTPEVVLGRMIRHELMEEEAKYIRSLSKGVTTSKNQDIALKATKKQKGKSVIEESSSGESEKAQALMRRI